MTSLTHNWFCGRPPPWWKQGSSTPRVARVTHSSSTPGISGGHKRFPPRGRDENHSLRRSRLGDDEAVSEGAAAGDPGAVDLLYLCMEVAGCPTVCRHCWAQGT